MALLVLFELDPNEQKALLCCQSQNHVQNMGGNVESSIVWEKMVNEKNGTFDLIWLG